MEFDTMSVNERFVLHGPDPIVPIPDDSLGQIIFRSLITRPHNNVAMVDAFTGRTVSNGRILQDSCNLAEALRRYGCSNDTVVSIFSENNIDFYIPVVASLFAGTILSPINHLYKSHELKHILDLTQPKLLFVSAKSFSKLMKLKEDIPFMEKIVIFNSNESIREAQSMQSFIEEQLKGHEITPHNFRPWNGDIKAQVAFIMPSSGTTGMSKGVMISHRNYNTTIAKEQDPRFGETTLIHHVSTAALPFYHIFGLSMGITALIKGYLLVVFDHFDELEFLNAIPKYKVTILNIVPSMGVLLSKNEQLKQIDVSSVVTIVCAGAPLGKRTEEALKERFNLRSISQGYGQTETTLVCTQTPKNDSKAGTCGKVVPLMCLKVCDPVTDKPLGPFELGEIRVNGPMVMKGYYRNKQSTEEAFDRDGWLKSGDLGYYDQDGYFYIVDRLKELIKYKGYQIPPAELEALLISHPKVLEAAVVGRPDELAGELPTAFIVKKTNDVTENEIQDYISETVSPQKKLRGGVLFVPVLPKNGTGKILRKHLREQLIRKNEKLEL